MYTDAPFVPALYTLLDRNGLNAVTAALPAGVIVCAFDELSTNLLLWQVSKFVSLPVVKGAVGGVKLDVYLAVELNLTLLTFPSNTCPDEVKPLPVPMYSKSVKFPLTAVDVVESATPLT